MKSTSFVWCVLGASATFFSGVELVCAAGYMDQNTYSTNGQVKKVRRERHLDHWDSDTLAYYLDEYPGYDSAVMFYAQWDSHSRTLAPYWAKIAETMDAGTSNSNLVMALFDCELNQVHMALCQAAGITHYPTMMFIGSGPYHDTDPFSRTIFGKKAAGALGEAPIANTVKFQGNWQYTDSIQDWIRTMQALSNWHTWSTEGFGKKLRNFFIPQGKKTLALPIGIPGRGATASSSSTGGAAGAASAGASASSFQVKELEAKLEKYEDFAIKLDKKMSQSSEFLDAILTGGKNYQDMFTLLHEQKAWTKSDRPNAEVLRHCVAELSLDYCQRLSKSAADLLVDDLMAKGKTVEDILGMNNLEQLMMDRIAEEEPYCALLDQCVITDFAGEACQPQQCPFQNKAACQYLTSCMSPALQKDIADALGLTLGNATQVPKEPDQGKKTKKTWGL
jgi:hypothetical protein